MNLIKTETSTRLTPQLAAWSGNIRDQVTMLWPGFPTVADGKIYATTGEAAQYGGEVGTSEFVCLNAYTGALKWKLPIEALAPRESVAIAYGKLYIIPGSVTDAVDAISGSEYDIFNQVWAIGSNTRRPATGPCGALTHPTHPQLKLDQQTLR